MGHKITDEELLDELNRRFEQNKISVRELKTLNEELKLVNKKLEESESLKSHFISNITNEIINPFTSILGLSRAILSVDKENWKKVVSMVALIYSEAFTLDFQFRNIFVAAKIEAGEIFPEIVNTDVLNVLESVIETFRIEARRKKVSVVLDHSFKVDDAGMVLFKTDPEKLKLIMSNLLNNAVSFSSEGGIVEVIARVDSGSLVICVRDHGIGISKENQKIIFDRFKRLDSGINSLNRGHGLGLSVNKAVLEILNGSIDIKSELGKGACFTISIPESDVDAFDFASEANETFFDTEEETF
ncbi:MAG: HAMP domain-containing sensor histidine kinase [Bacteroidales bacterium]|jgi:signal transduction histidine kinase|nr:HAMP domain-containing sensor histidine kinase [Bacteroidales bacterium]MDD4384455.1 HAMP domain-containing sensor histidine kinase [Bacteroidales bacterium]MDY0196808.1 HAMP domain-containing sensor histidine kinase [Tenuifilaceae bacterium]